MINSNTGITNLIVHYFGHGLINKPLNIRTDVRDPNTGLVRYSDVD